MRSNRVHCLMTQLFQSQCFRPVAEPLCLAILSTLLADIITIGNSFAILLFFEIESDSTQALSLYHDHLGADSSFLLQCHEDEQAPTVRLRMLRCAALCCAVLRCAALRCAVLC